MILLWAACVLGWGRLVLGGLAPEALRERGAWGLAMALGLGLLTGLWTLAGLAGAPLYPTLAALTLLPGLLGWRRMSSLPSVRLSRPEAVCFAMVAGSLAVVWADALWQPLGRWDHLIGWYHSSLAMLRDGTFLGTAHLHPASALNNRDYPLLVPLAGWSVMALAGRADERLVLLLGPVLYTAMLAVLYAGCREVSSRAVSAVALAGAASLPLMVRFLDGSVASGYADVPLAFLASCFLLAGLRWGREGGVRRALLAAVLAGVMVHAKREGLVLAAAGTALAPLLRRPRPPEVLAWLAGLAAVATPWLLRWQHLVDPRYLPTRRVVGSTGEGLARVPWILGSYARDLLLRPGVWSAWWWVGLALAPGRRWTREEAFLAGFIALSLAAQVAAFGLAGVGPEVSSPLTRSRAMLHVFPALVLWCASRAEIQAGNGS